MTRQDILEKQVKFSYLAIGSNLGKKRTNIEKAINLLNYNNIFVLDSSSYYESPSWPNNNFPKFLNIVVSISTDLSLIDLFKTVKKIEIDIGRRKSLINHPRKCDIDIIDFKGLYLKKELIGQKIETPHPRMHSRNFVIFPLFELNKNWIHPKTKVKINKLMLDFTNKDFSGIRIV